MRVVLQDKPRITVCFPFTWTQIQKDQWIAEWKKNNNRLN